MDKIKMGVLEFWQVLVCGLLLILFIGVTFYVFK